MTMDFASLHTHSHNSILDGYSRMPELVQRTLDIGAPGFGLTDHGNAFGIAEMLRLTKSAGLIGLPGCEFYVAPENPEGAFVKGAVFYGANGERDPRGDVSSRGAYLHLTVWAYNNEGLKNLFKLSTYSYNPDRFRSAPRIDFDLLARHSDGLIVATGCPSSEISTRFRLGQDDKAYEYAGRLLEVFGRDRLFVEIMDHDMDISLERDLLPKQMKLAKDLGLELLATNDSHYTFPGEGAHHEEMLCKQSGSRMSDPTFDEGGTRFALSGDGYYMKSGKEMADIFDPEDFPRAVTNSRKILEMAQDIELKYDPHLRPKPKLPEGFDDEISYYRHRVNEGFEERYGNAPEEIRQEAIKRNLAERDIIEASGFAGYMLVVEDYLNWTKRNFSTRDDAGDILAYPIGGGRGSVGGSIHAYELGISELCPIRWDLIAERFLSAGRGATYEITYDDGSVDRVLASDIIPVVAQSTREVAKRYTHQLEVGNEIAIKKD